jgi:hypothetical protein
MRKGDKLICKETVNNIFGMPLFEKDKEYEILYVDNEKSEIMVVLNHNLYANEYNEYSLDWINKNFKYVER